MLDATIGRAQEEQAVQDGVVVRAFEGRDIKAELIVYTTEFTVASSRAS